MSPNASRLAEVELDVLWTIHVRPSGSAELYVNSRVTAPGALSSALSGDIGDTVLGYEDSLRRDAEIVHAETYASAADRPSYSLAGVLVHPTVLAEHVTHFLQWNLNDSSVIHWSREMRLGETVGTADSELNQRGVVRIADMSAGARAAVRRLDGAAVQMAYERLEGALKRLGGVRDDVEILPKRLKVFISYRRTHIEYAKALHRLLSSEVNGRLFAPYLDEHDVRTGLLPEQLETAMSSADVFVPIVSHDYAEPGTYSMKELTFALRRAGSHDIGAKFIVPLFVGSPETEVANQLGEYLRGQVHGLEDLRPPAARLKQFLQSAARLPSRDTKSEGGVDETRS